MVLICHAEGGEGLGSGLQRHDNEGDVGVGARGPSGDVSDVCIIRHEFDKVKIASLEEGCKLHGAPFGEGAKSIEARGGVGRGGD
jgi:hypothetical protein